VNDPIELPKSFPLNSARIVLELMRGGRSLDEEAIAAGVTLVAWGAQFAAPGPKVVGLADPILSMDLAAREALAQAIGEAENPAIKTMGIIPWSIIVEWVAKKLIEHILKR
jgi:hypothetical protein